MICYKDMTFCSSCCINTDCRRHFGKEESDGAYEWMGEDAPVAFSDFSGSCDAFTPPKEMFKT